MNALAARPSPQPCLQKSPVGQPCVCERTSEAIQINVRRRS